MYRVCYLVKYCWKALYVQYNPYCFLLFHGLWQCVARYSLQEIMQLWATGGCWDSESNWNTRFLFLSILSVMLAQYAWLENNSMQYGQVANLFLLTDTILSHEFLHVNAGQWVEMCFPVSLHAGTLWWLCLALWSSVCITPLLICPGWEWEEVNSRGSRGVI